MPQRALPLRRQLRLLRQEVRWAKSDAQRADLQVSSLEAEIETHVNETIRLNHLLTKAVTLLERYQGTVPTPVPPDPAMGTVVDASPPRHPWSRAGAIVRAKRRVG